MARAHALLKESSLALGQAEALLGTPQCSLTWRRNPRKPFLTPTEKMPCDRGREMTSVLGVLPHCSAFRDSTFLLDMC